MAFGTSSKIFTAFVRDVMGNVSALDLDADTIKVTLYGNSGTPDQTVASASTAYNAGQWTSTNEVINTNGAPAGQWTTGGISLASVTSTFATNVYTFDAADKAGSASDTITNAYGCLVFDDTIASPVAKQGICYLAFGGANSVTAGTFTISFNASGIMQVTV